MAGAKPGVHVVQLKPIQVPQTLLDGNKFIKWDDDATLGTPVTMKVDPEGYILYWVDQHKEIDFLDISLIRDTRTGKYARTPKSGHANLRQMMSVSMPKVIYFDDHVEQNAIHDAKLREVVSMGAQDVPLEDKTMTICYCYDMVNVNFISFAATSVEVAKEWTDELFKYATNLLAPNASPLSFLKKCYTKLSFVTTNDLIPVRNIVKAFAQHKDDRKKIEKALEASNLPSGKNDVIKPSVFSFERFLSFYQHLSRRPEVDKIFQTLGARNKPYLTAEQFRDFLNKQQRDPRLNEILYPYCDLKKAQALTNQFEPNQTFNGKDRDIPKGHLSREGFLRYLLSDDCALFSSEKLDLSDDMDQPLADYFINSSHNTYLSGHQLTGKSSVEIYRQVLLTGCRCVELDCWDGKTAEEEPIITHGFTMCTDIVFKEVLEAIAETAFKVSDYPVLLSFENHCSPKQQAKMAQHCRNILGDMLLTEPLDLNPLKPGKPLPSPAQLKRKFIIKAKKHARRPKPRSHRPPEIKPALQKTPSITSGDAGEDEFFRALRSPVPAQDEKVDKEERSLTPAATGDGADDGGSSSESEMESDEEEEEDVIEEEVKKEKGTASQEAVAGMEMSALVNYVQPARFHSFEYADKRNRSYECTSFVETQATGLLKEFPVEFVNFNKRQISRIYPRGTRVDSSNYMPQIFWNAGCQLVALNFQTLDLAMQLNLGIFEYNCRSGYLLKPDFMRRRDRLFDPFTESTVDGIVAGTVEVKVISGQFLTDKKIGTYVEVDMYGLPADTVRKRFKTRVVPANGINPVYDEEPFVFRKVVLPGLATLRIGAFDENGKLLGHRVLPVEGLRPGYRHICLRNELNQPHNLSMLFVYITVNDYVSDAFADLANALTNPIAYQSKLEKHSEQLAVLEEDFNTDIDDTTELKEVKEPIVMPEADLQRHFSLKSNPSPQPDMSALTRSGSTQAKPTKYSKQESSSSGASQASPGAGAISAVAAHSASPLMPTENGGVKSIAENSRLNGPKAVSLPGSPLHSLAPADNGAMKLLKIDVSQTTQLKDPDIIEPVTIETVKQCKSFIKVQQKLEKDVDSLRKRQERTRINMQELNELQEDKLLTSQVKSKSSVEKEHRKSFKRASKKGNLDDVGHKNQQELMALLMEQEKKHRELKRQQTESFIGVCKEQHKAQLDLYLKYHPQQYDALTQMADISLDSQLKKLDEIHDKEVQELKKTLEAQNREEMKALAKKHKEKFELARAKREATQKHVNLAVQERKKLRDILERRKGEVEERHEELKRRILEERTKDAQTRKRYSL